MKEKNVDKARNILFALAGDGGSSLADIMDVITNSAVMCADTVASHVPECNGELNALGLMISNMLERHAETRSLPREVFMVADADETEVH